VQNLVLTVCLNTVYLTHAADAHVTVLTCVFLHYVIVFVCCVICRHLNVICDWHIFRSLRRVLMLEHII